MHFRDKLKRKEISVRIRKMEASKEDMELNKLRLDMNSDNLESEIKLQEAAIEKAKQELNNIQGEK